MCSFFTYIILTVVENSSICKFSRIYLIKFESKNKNLTEITLLARTTTISFNIYYIVYIKFIFMSYKYLLSILFSIFVITTKKNHKIPLFFIQLQIVLI